MNPQPYYGVGFLKSDCPDTATQRLIAAHTSSISGLKDTRRKLLRELAASPRILSAHEINLLLASTRHYEYHFADITYDKLDRYKRFLDISLSLPIHFCALVINKKDPKFNTQIYGNYWDAYIRYTLTLCKSNVSSEEKCSIIADYMNKPRNSNKEFDEELKSLACVANALRIQSVGSPMLQICDLLLGAVVFEHKAASGEVNNSNRARAKMEFVSYLKRKILLSPDKKYSLASNITLKRPIYFSVWNLQLR